MENNVLLSEIGERCGDVSLQCSDIAGYLNQLNANIQGDVSRLIELRQVMAALSRTQAENSNARCSMRIRPATRRSSAAA